jgi:glycosyltransferase involved in cell wall biosynthesis
MKIYVLEAHENWIVDRIANEWKQHNPQTLVSKPEDADILWILAQWRWRTISPSLLSSKKVIVSMHHVVPNKFNVDEFKYRDQFVDSYHTPCKQTMDNIRPYTDKPIHVVGYWCNPSLWYEMDKSECREEMGLPEKSILIGSFQRDTEGHDLISPKLEKGPDIFCDMVEKYHKAYNAKQEIQVVLAGWRRQYVMNRLEKAGIKYHYFEMPELDVINKLYNALDLYIVGSRYEGGPQALLECAITNTPIISTDAGMAREVLSEESIYNSASVLVSPNTEEANLKVQKYIIPVWFDKYREMFRTLINE